jgi:hypothetical protein
MTWKDRLLVGRFGIDDNNTIRDCSDSNNDNTNNQSSNLRFEVPMVEIMEIILWDETKYSGCRYQRLGVIRCLSSD